MTEEKAAAIGIQLLSSLAEAHGSASCTATFKPANVLLVRRKDRRRPGEALDFGIAKLNEARRARPSPASPSSSARPVHVARAGQGRPARRASDLYSVGALLFELVTGRIFPSTFRWATVNMHMTQKAPRVNDVTPTAR